MYIFCGPFLNIAVLLYASFYMDSFGWGKTRKVISEETSKEGTQNELTRLELGDKANMTPDKSVGSSEKSAALSQV